MERALHIAIAGNIGSGKTTLATLLAKHMNFMPEYEDPSVNPYIVDFYQDMNRWSFNLQVYFLNNRLTRALAVQRSGVNTVQDRTLYEDAEIFAPILFSMNLMDQRDYDTYQSLYQTVISLIKPPDLVIYLRASISTLGGQIAERNRDYEDNIRIDYLRKLNERYDAWYDKYSIGKKIDFSVDKLNFKDRPEDLGTIVTAVEARLYGLFS